MHDYIQRLPVELVKYIAEYLPSEDLFNFRLASKDAANKTTQHMARTYFQ